jgi:hypothetical protein
MNNKVDYDIINKFFNYDDKYLEYHKVTNNIKAYDIEYGVEVIFNYYRKYGFPHYKIREEEKHDHMRKLIKFNHKSIIDDNKIIQTMHCLRLAWSYFPQFWNVKCGNAKMKT